MHVCPVCGSPVLEGLYLVRVRQDEYGHWSFAALDEDEMNSWVEQNDIDVICTNPECGNPMLPDGRVIAISKDDTDLTYWLKIHDLSPDLAITELTPEQRDEYKAWADSLTYTPWQGKLSETQEI